MGVGPSIPLPGTAAPDAELDASGRPRVPPGQRFRQSGSGIGRLAGSPSASASARRPQAQATSPAPPPVAEPAVGSAERDRSGAPPRIKRGQTEADFDLETYVGGKDDWKNALAVEDEQLVDWSASDETVTTGEELGRKR
jgi:pyruvate/2-oxoglutarate dehydrogenase complex dihydrolipoamide acyltransferase (E2) component